MIAAYYTGSPIQFFGTHSNMANEKLHWEDFEIGKTFPFGRKEVSKEEIITFAGEFDPQPFHLDEAAAKKSLLGGLAASGWHSCAMLMRMVCDSYLLNATSLGSPGMIEVKWLAPVRPDDILTARYTCLDRGTSVSRPEIGRARMYYEMLNQAGHIVMTWDLIQLFARRSPESGHVQEKAPLKIRENASDVTRRPGDHKIKYFEDVELGDELELGAVEFSADIIKEFANAYDPQRFHVDEIAAKDSLFGALCASGWHTAAIWMQQMVRYCLRAAHRLRAEGQPVPQIGPSPGFKDMRWLKPVYAGDVITFRSWAERKVDVTSKPNWGLLIISNEGCNQNNELVFTFTGQVFLERRTPIV